MARNPDWFLFNKIFESYDKLKFQKAPCDRLVVHAGIREGERVLEVACGTGWATLAATHGVHHRLGNRRLKHRSTFGVNR